MTFRPAILLVPFVIALLFHTGCEQHPASQTVKDYKEKQAVKEEQTQKNSKPIQVSGNAPTYLPKDHK